MSRGGEEGSSAIPRLPCRVLANRDSGLPFRSHHPSTWADPSPHLLWPHLAHQGVQARAARLRDERGEKGRGEEETNIKERNGRRRLMGIKIGRKNN
jgi:hypothetical protein